MQVDKFCAIQMKVEKWFRCRVFPSKGSRLHSAHLYQFWYQGSISISR